MANHLKSNIYLAGLDDMEWSKIMAYTGFTTGDIPFRYLGVPILGVYLKVVDYAPFLDRISKTLLA